MNNEQFTEIEKEDKEVYLNIQEDKDKDKDKDKKKKKKKEGKVTPTPFINKGGDVSPIEEDFGTVDIEHKKRDTFIEKKGEERDYSLPTDQFKNKYIDVPGQDTSYLLDPNKANELEVLSYGEGVEDYRDYIKNPIKGQNLDYNRALNQSNAVQLGNTFLRFGLNIIPEFLQQGSNIGESLYNTVTGRDEYGNDFSELMQEIKDNTNENLAPIYQENPSEFLQASDFAWWADRGSNLATSVIAFLGLGYVTGGLSVATRFATLLKALGRVKQLGAVAKGSNQLSNLLRGEVLTGTKLSDIMKKMSLSKRGFSPTTMGDALFNSYLLTSAESMSSAVEIYNNVYDTKRRELLDSGYSSKDADKQAKEEAIKAGDRAFGFNQYNIMLNMTSVMPFLRRTGAVNRGRVAKRTIKGGASRLAFEGAQEYMEETVNFLSESYATNPNFDLTEAMRLMGTPQGLESGLSGLVGGVAQTGLTLSGQYVKIRRDNDGIKRSDYQRYKEEYAAQEDLKTFYSSLKKGEKVNELDLFSTTEDRINLHNKIDKLNRKLQEVPDNYAELEKEIGVLQDRLFTTTAYDSFKTGMVTEFKDSLEGLKEVVETEEEKEILDQKLQDLTVLQNIYEQTANILKGEEAYQYASEIFYFKDLIKGSKEKADDHIAKITPLIEDLTNVSRDSFNFNFEEGTFEFKPSELEQIQKDELTTEIEEKKEGIISFKDKLSKEEDRLSNMKKIKETDNSKQISASENVISKLKEDIGKETKDLSSLGKKLGKVGRDTKALQGKVEKFIEELELNKSFRDFKAYLSNVKELTKQSEEYQKRYDALTSFEGQSKARKEYQKNKESYIRKMADIKAKAKETQRKAKLQKDKEKTENDNTNEEGEKEWKEFVDSGVVSDKKIEEIAGKIVNNLKLNDREQAIYQDKTDEVEKVIQELKEEIVPTTPAEVLFDAYKEDVTSDLVKEATGITNMVVVDSITTIFRRSNNNDIKSKLLIGLIKAHYKDDKNNPDSVLLGKFYNAFEKFNDDVTGVNHIGLINSPNNFEVDLAKFLDDNIDRALGDEIDNNYNVAFNIETEEDDDGQSDMYSSYLKGLDKSTFEKVSKAFDELFDRHGLDVNKDSFTKIARTINRVLKPELGKRTFYKLQGYVQFMTGKRLNKFYHTTVLTKKELKEEEAIKRKIAKATKISDYDTQSIQDIDSQNRFNTRATFFASEGIILPDDILYDLDTYEDEDYYTSAKSYSASNKIAYKALNLKKVLRKSGVVDKKTVFGDMNSNMDTRLKSKEGIREGDVVEFFVVEDEGVQTREGVITNNKDDNGNWVTTVQALNQPAQKQNPLERAPIGIKINGSVLQDAFLHVPSFVNVENLVTKNQNVNDLQKDLAELQALRKQILEGNNPIKIVSNVTKGHLFKTHKGRTIDRLPNVEVAMKTKGNFDLGGGKIKRGNLDIGKYINGAMYAMIPEVDGTFTPYGLIARKPTKFQAEQISNLFKIKFMNPAELNEEEKSLAEFYKSHGRDLSKNDAINFQSFKNLMRNVIDLRSFNNDHLDISNEILKPHKNGNYYGVFLMKRGPNGGIIFKAGQKDVTHFTVDLRKGQYLSREEAEETVGRLTQLVVKNKINFSRASLGKKVLLPFTDIGGVSTLVDYSSFIKENTDVNTQSYKDEAGEDVYRVQKSIFFENKEGTTEDAPIIEGKPNLSELSSAELDQELEDDFGLPNFNIETEDSLFEEGVEAQISKEHEELMRSNSEEAELIREALDEGLHIKGLPVVYQDYFVRSLINLSINLGTKEDVLSFQERKAGAVEGLVRNKFDNTLRTFLDTLEERNRRAYKRVEDNKKESLNKAYETFAKEYVAKNKVYKDIILTALENIDKLFDLAMFNVKSYNIINVYENTEDDVVEGGDNIRVNWDSNYFFSLNGKDQLTKSVKNMLMGIQDAYWVNKTVKIGEAPLEGEEDNRIEVPQRILVNNNLFGLDVVVPFDRLYEEVMLTFSNAYNNYEGTENDSDSLFDNYIAQLQRNVTQKPYFKNLITKLKRLSSKDKSSFVSNMSKSNINHITTYRAEQHSQDHSGNRVHRTYLTNKRTNNSENSKVFLDELESNFYNSNLVAHVSKDSYDVIFNEDNVKLFFDKARNLVNTIKNYQSTRLEEATHNKLLTRREIAEAKKYAYEPTQEIIRVIKLGFKDLGFNFTEEFLYDFYNGNYYAKGNKVRIYDINEPTGFIGVLKEQIYPDGKLQKINRKANPIFTDGYLADFAKYYSSFDHQLYTASYTNGEGKNIYGYSLNQFLTDRAKDLKTNVNTLRDLKEDVFQGHSIILDFLYDEKKDRINKENSIYKFFNYWTYDSNVRIRKDFKARNLEKLSDAGFEQVALGLFLNKANAVTNNIFYKNFDGVEKGISYRNGRLFAPPFSDKRRAMGFDVPIFQVIPTEDGKITEDNVIYDLVLDEVVMPEYNRIIKQQENENEVNINGYEEGGKLFTFMPELNYAEDHILFDVIRDEETGKIIKKTLKTLEGNAKLKATLKQLVFVHIEELKANKIELWKEYDIVRRDKFNFIDYTYEKKGYDTNVDRLAYEYVTNYLINNATFFKLFAGDTAQYLSKPKASKDFSTIQDYIHNVSDNITEYDYSRQVISRTQETVKSIFDNVGKRLAGIIAPGTDVIAEKGENIKVVILRDVSERSIEGVSRSLNLPYYIKLLGKDKAMDNFSRMDAGDGMGYSSFKEWATIEAKRGVITRVQRDKLIQKEKQRQLNKEDIDIINNILSQHRVNSYKPIYFNNFKDGKEMRSLYMKQSSLPLIRQLTENLELEHLRLAMVNDNVDMAVFNSVVKSGATKTKYDLYDNKGRFKKDISFTKEEEDGVFVDADYVITAPRQGLKIQLDTPIEDDKLNITDGSQQRKLIFSDILNIKDFIHPSTGNKIDGFSLKKEFNQLYVELFKNNYNKLADELAYDSKTGKLDLKLLQKVLKDEFENRGYPLSDLYYLGITEDGTAFRQPLWTSTLSGKIESVLVSIVNNRVRTLHSPGHSYILGSNVGFRFRELLEGEKAQDFIKDKSNHIVYDKEWAERGDFTLKGQGKDEVTGEVTGAEVMISSRFRASNGDIIKAEDLMDKEGFIDTTKLPKELLEVFGYRIPTQGLNSMSYVKVVGLLPDSHSEMIIAPAEFTAQMGSDFDIDKLYMNTYNHFIDDDGNLKKEDSAFINEKGVFEESYNIQDDEGKNRKLFNSILDIKLAILKNNNPLVQSKIINPLDENLFEGLAEEIENAYKDEGGFYSPISQETLKNKYLSGSNGNEAIGVFARASTLNSLLQHPNKKHHHFYYVENKTDKERVLKFSNGINKEGKTYWNNMLSSTSVHYHKDLTKGDLLSMLISASVDNEKLQILGRININSETYNTVVGLILSGFPADHITYFINQPIIREYTKLSKKVNDPSINFNKDDRFIAIQEKYSDGLLFTPAQYEDKSGIDLFPNFNKKDFKTPPFQYTLASMKDNIDLRREIFMTKTLSEEYQKEQTAILYNFIRFNKTFEKLNTLNEAINVDGGNTLGNSLLYLQGKEKQLMTLDAILISNVTDLLGELELPKSITEQEELIDKGYVEYSGGRYLKPTTILGGMYAYAVQFGNKIFNSDKTLFPYNSRIIQDLTHRGYIYLKRGKSTKNLKQKVDIEKKALNLSKQFLFSSLFQNLFRDTVYNERKRILVDEVGSPALVNVLDDIRTNNHTKYYNNPLLSRLSLRLGSERELGDIRFNATNETTQMLFISEAFKTLLEDKSIWYKKDKVVYRGMDIAMDLIRHQYLTKGVQFRREFLKYFPGEIFEALGINESLRGIDFNSPEPAVASFLSEAYQRQLYQHYPEFISDFHQPIEVMESFSEDTGTIIVPKIATEVRVDKYVIGQVDTTFVPFVLEQDNIDHSVYRAMELAGDPEKGITEFDSSRLEIRSILPYNNVITAMEQDRVNKNLKTLQKALTKEVIYKHLHEGKWRYLGTTKLDYLDKLERYKRAGDADEISLVSEKGINGFVDIYDTGEFMGFISNPSKKIRFSKDFKEGVHFENTFEDGVEVIEQPEGILSPVDEFKTTFKVIEGNAEQTMINILETLKQNSSDPSRNYLYDVMIDSVPSLIANNPDLKIVLHDRTVGKGRVYTKAGEIRSISLSVVDRDTLVLNNKNSNKLNIHKLVTEEFLHAFTMSKAAKGTKLYNDLSNIRLEYLYNLKTNNPEGYKEYENVALKSKNIILMYDALQSGLRTIFDIETSLRKHDPSLEAYKRIKEAIKKEKDKGVLDMNVDSLMAELKKDFKISADSYKHYYHLIDTVEFIAGIFNNPNLQEQLNYVDDKSKKTLLEKVIAIVVRALQSLGILNTREGQTKVWDKLFKNNVEKNSLLEAGIAKSILLVKNYRNTKFGANEKGILKEGLKGSIIKATASNINSTFGLRIDNELQYTKNGSEVAKTIRSLFDGVKIKTIKKNYVLVTNEGEEQSTKHLSFASVNPLATNIQLRLDDNSNFNLEQHSDETDDTVQQKRRDRLVQMNEYRVDKLNEMINVARARGHEGDKEFRYLTTVLDNLTDEKAEKELENFTSLNGLIEFAQKDLIEVNKMISSSELDYAHIVYLQKVISNWLNTYSLYFTREEQDYSSLLTEKFNDVIDKYRVLDNTLSSRLISLFEQGIKTEFKKDVDLLSYFKEWKDPNVFRTEGRDISMIDNVFASFIHVKAGRAFNQTKRETYDKVVNIKNLIKEAKPALERHAGKFNKNGYYDILLQKYADGSLTGDLVNPFSKEFIDLIKNKYRSLSQANNQEDKIKIGKEINDWLNENTTFFNPYILYRGDNTTEKEAHIKELKEILGNELYEFYKEEQDYKYEVYQDLYRSKRDRVLVLAKAETVEELSVEELAELKLWEAENSPFLYYDSVVKGKEIVVEAFNELGDPFERRVFNRGFEYIINVPNKTVNGEDTGYYDKSFDIILNDKDILKLYKGYQKELNDLKVYLPQSAQDAIRYNGLPEIRKTFWENLTQDKIGVTAGSIIDNFKEAIRTDDLSTITRETADRKSGRVDRTLDFNLFRDNHKEWKAFYSKKEMEYELEQGYAGVPESFVQQTQKEFNNIVAERKSKDLGKLLTAYAGLALTYKHKSRMQDVITAGEIFINNLPEYKFNAEGKPLLETNSQRATKPSSIAYKRFKEMYAHYINNFYNNPYKIQGVTKTRILTSKEKKDKAELMDIKAIYNEKLLELKDEYTSNKISKHDYTLQEDFIESELEKVDEMIDDIGGNLTYSKVGDQALKLFQLKGMGWNILAGFGNLGYGVVGNLVEAADGRILNRKEMLDAMKLTMNSLGRNATFNLWNGKGGVALKIRALMDRNDILKEASHELYSNSIKGTFGEKFRFMTPYNMQKRTEYLNQAPVMIAFYKKTMYKLENGEEISLWDAYKDNAQWNVEKYGAEPDLIINKVNAKITQFIKKVHGNYDPASPLKIKQGIIGRAAAQFRTWFFEAWQQRWGAYDYDEILEVGFKGRYLSIGSYANSKNSLGKEYGYPGTLLDILKGILISTVGFKTKFGKEGISELDAANMRKLVVEIQSYLALYATYLGLVAMFRDDEEPEKNQMMLNLTLNTINRVRNELTLYFTPDIITMLNNPAPAMSLVNDVVGILETSKHFMFSEDVISTGTYTGQRRSVRTISSLIPFASQVKSFSDQAHTEFRQGLTAKLIKLLKEKNK